MNWKPIIRSMDGRPILALCLPLLCFERFKGIKIRTRDDAFYWSSHEKRDTAIIITTKRKERHFYISFVLKSSAFTWTFNENQWQETGKQRETNQSFHPTPQCFSFKDYIAFMLFNPLFRSKSVLENQLCIYKTRFLSFSCFSFISFMFSRDTNSRQTNNRLVSPQTHQASRDKIKHTSPASSLFGNKEFLQFNQEEEEEEKANKMLKNILRHQTSNL